MLEISRNRGEHLKIPSVRNRTLRGNPCFTALECVSLVTPLSVERGINQVSTFMCEFIT